MNAVESVFRCLLFLLVFAMSSQWGMPFPPVGKAFLYVSYADLLLAATFGVWCLLILLRRDFKDIRWPPLPFWIFLGLVFICTAIAAKKKVAIKEAIQAIEYFGVAALLFLNGFRDEKDWHLAFKVLAASVLCNVLLALAQYFSADNAFKIAGAFGNKNVFAAWLALVVPFILGLACFERCPICRYGMVLLLVPAMYVNLSAGSLIAIAVASLVVSAVQCRKGLVLAVASWAFIFAVGPKLFHRGGHGEVLKTSIAPFVASNYSFTPESANWQAQVVYNETGYDAARDFLAVYQTRYPEHEALVDHPWFIEPDIFDWGELFTQLIDEKGDGGTAAEIWKQIPDDVKESAQAGLKKMEEDDDYEYRPNRGQRQLLVSILNKRFEGKSDEEAMEARVELTDEFDFSLRLPVRLRMKTAVEKANARWQEQKEAISEELASTRETHKDLEEGELLGIIEDRVDALEEKKMVFQLTEMPQAVPNTRYLRWHAAWKLIRANRAAGLIGNGPGHFRDGVNQSYETGGPLRKPDAQGRAGAKDTWGLSSDEPDSFNQYLVLAAELGFIGLFSFVWMLAAGIGEGVRGLVDESDGRKAIALGGVGAMVGIVVVSVFHPVLVRGLGVVFVFVLSSLFWLREEAAESDSNEDAREQGEDLPTVQ
ncbi:MAG: hypothetical protein QGG53_15410 [Planctomycetota bacterium]|nr:hypothetical protein [Planctomycetota bacterium]